MKCSVELPLANLELSDRFDYDFVIASTCFASMEYREWYGDSDRFMILDNGAFETGQAVDDKEYIELARELKPDVLVIPDVYQNNAATGVRAMLFLDTWRRDPLKDIELMGVLQGESWGVLESMYDIIYKHNCAYIGFPYATTIDRYQFLKAHPEISNIHILGLPVFTEVMGLLTLSNVVSIDSSLPVKVTADSAHIEDCLWSDTYVKSNDSTLDTKLLKYNLDMFRKICHGHYRIART